MGASMPIPAGYVSAEKLGIVLKMSADDVRRLRQNCKFNGDDLKKVGSRTFYKETAKPKPPEVREDGLVSLTDWASIHNIEYRYAKKFVADGDLEVVERNGRVAFVRAADTVRKAGH